MKEDFKVCKETFENYSNGKITEKDFNNWSKENCETCFFYLITGKKYCLFGGKNKNK